MFELITFQCALRCLVYDERHVFEKSFELKCLQAVKQKLGPQPRGC